MSALAPDSMKISQTVGFMNLILPVLVQKSQSITSVDAFPKGTFSKLANTKFILLHDT